MKLTFDLWNLNLKGPQPGPLGNFTLGKELDLDPHSPNIPKVPHMGMYVEDKVEGIFSGFTILRKVPFPEYPP